MTRPVEGTEIVTSKFGSGDDGLYVETVGADKGLKYVALGKLLFGVGAKAVIEASE